MPKRVTSWRDHLRVIAPVGNTAPFEEMSQPWRAVGNTVSDLTCPRFEPQTSHSRDKHVIARPTNQTKFKLTKITIEFIKTNFF